MSGAGTLGVQQTFSIPNFDLDHIALSPSEPGEFYNWTAHIEAISSDFIFDRIVDSVLANISASLPTELARSIRWNHANSILLKIHDDNSAELHIDRFDMVATILTTREVKKDEIILENEYTDVLEMYFEGFDLLDTDRYICIIRHKWRFGLLLDLRRNVRERRKDFERALPSIHRRLLQHHIIMTLNDGKLFEKVMSLGWFPFVEIISHEYLSIVRAVQDNLPADDCEAAILSNFDEARLDKMIDRWARNPRVNPYLPAFQTAVRLYRSGEMMASTKQSLTEIEGMLRLAHPELRDERSILSLLEKIVDKRNSGLFPAGSILFPDFFLKFLKTVTFSHFDRGTEGEPRSRHAVSHGAVPAERYTAIVALQSILTWDQLMLLI